LIQPSFEKLVCGCVRFSLKDYSQENPTAARSAIETSKYVAASKAPGFSCIQSIKKIKSLGDPLAYAVEDKH
jgi:hypothetical protein